VTWRTEAGRDCNPVTRPGQRNAEDTLTFYQAEGTLSPIYAQALDAVPDGGITPRSGTPRPAGGSRLHRPVSSPQPRKSSSTTPAVTQKSLTATLRRLERNGIIARVVISTRPVSVEYRITPLGKTLRPPVEVILDWAAEQMPLIEQARRRFDDEVGRGQPQAAGRRALTTRFRRPA
jgi:hypothetical protein